MELIELTNPDFLNTALMSGLFRRAFPEGSLVTGGFDEAPERFREMVSDPRYRFIVGAEEDGMALAVLFLPRASENVHAQWLAMYNEGSSQLRGHVVDVGVGMLRASGHDKVWAINQTGRPASVWARMYKRAGEVRKVGDVMEVTLKDEDVLKQDLEGTT